jgi:hypothetical protein
MAKLRTATKFFTYGLVIGILFAPRSGRDTRSAAIGWVNTTLKNTLGM